MKKLLKKSLSILLLGAAINGVYTINHSIEANAAWKSNSTGWWYTEGNSYVKNAWRYIDGKWYYFDSTGYMKKGWLKDGQDWYYLNSNGSMKTGWIKSKQDWYYLDPFNEGKMAANQWTYVGYHLNSNGVWDKTSKYLRKDIFANTGTVNTKSGVQLYEAGDPSPLTVVNGEPCVFTMTWNDEYRWIGLNTLNVYGDNNAIVDETVIK